MYLTNNLNQITFTNLKQQKHLSENILRELNQEMGCIQSSTKLMARTIRMKNKITPDLTEKLTTKIYQLRTQINGVLDNIFDNCKKFSSIKQLADSLINGIKSNGNKANCFEYMVLIMSKLKENSVSSTGFKVTVKTNDYESEHFASVIGLRKGAIIERPKTWGTKAYIIDAWTGIAGPAFDVIQGFKTNLSYGQTIKSVDFMPANIDNYVDLIK